MALDGKKGVFHYCCRSCGAALQVRVGFRGKLVWTVAEDGSFGESEPEMQGKHQDPQLICSADVMHTTGFKLQDGSLVADPEFEGSG